jgi:ectoine hydroxylase
MLSAELLDSFERQGFCLIPDGFSREEVELIRDAVPAALADDSPRRVLEKGTGVVRSVYGSHLTHDTFGRLVRHPRLLHAAEQLLASAVYVYQFKLNVKAAFSGDVWDWHQDYIFWREEDGMPTSRVVNAVLFLDDVTEFNAPLFFIPGSHREDVIDVAANAHIDGVSDTSRPWLSNLTADLKYALPRDVVARLAERNGMASAKGAAGTVLFFHPNLLHASSNNISPFSRVMALVTYNSVHNAPQPVEHPRPEFLASRDVTPLVAVDGDALRPVHPRV